MDDGNAADDAGGPVVCRLVNTPPADIPVLPDAAADWQAILKDGKLVVGTAVDYPPFEFYDASFQIDGFDPALARAIGKQLGVEVEFVDLAFDGLAQA
nr:transporter substrate-binding domain-containing protein [Caldilineaceae bacterium]